MQQAFGSAFKEANNMTRIEEFFDRNHDHLLKYGGLLIALFLMVFVPVHAHLDTKKKMLAEFSAQNSYYSELERENQALKQNLRLTENELTFYKSTYNRTQTLMREVDCLARNIYFEAGGESRRGKIAVAEVTMNRVNNRNYPKTVCGVVYQRSGSICQFSWVCEGKRQIIANPEWRESKKIAENVLISKRRSDIIGGAKFFHADYVSPDWAGTKEMVTQIGRHIFYR